MREADTAMYEAKRAGGNRVEVFHAALGTAARARFDIEAELHRALEQGELVAHYQPVVDLADLSVVGFEALVRWAHPTLGLLPPAQFLPVAQDAGLLPTIDRHVLAQVVGLLQDEATGRARLLHGIHVNVSAQWLREPQFVRDVVGLIQAASIDPTSICLELTEEGFIGSSLSTRQSLAMLRDFGVRVAIDDFGTGYSSLDQVSRLEFDVLKLDKRFVSQLRGGRRDRTIMRCLLDLADGLEVVAVAEGIETETQAAELQEMGCRYGQGYLYAKPEAEPRWHINALQPSIS